MDMILFGYSELFFVFGCVWWVTVLKVTISSSSRSNNNAKEIACDSVCLRKQLGLHYLPANTRHKNICFDAARAMPCYYYKVGQTIHYILCGTWACGSAKRGCQLSTSLCCAWIDYSNNMHVRVARYLCLRFKDMAVWHHLYWLKLWWRNMVILKLVIYEFSLLGVLVKLTKSQWKSGFFL